MTAYTEDIREAALIRLMERYGDSVKRICCVYLRDLSSAEDAAQDTFIKAYGHIDALLSGEIASEKAWLMRIAVNTCKDVLRTAWIRRIDRRKPIEELPLFTSDAHEENIDLTRAIMALDTKYKDLIVLHFYQGMNLRECAQALGISAASATRRMQQAQKLLKKELERS